MSGRNIFSIEFFNDYPPIIRNIGWVDYIVYNSNYSNNIVVGKWIEPSYFSFGNAIIPLHNSFPFRSFVGLPRSNGTIDALSKLFHSAACFLPSVLNVRIFFEHSAPSSIKNVQKCDRSCWNASTFSCIRDTWSLKQLRRRKQNSALLNSF